MKELQMELLRHGETEAGKCFLGRTDAALTAEGWQQMREGLQGLSPADFDLIISSPLQRCQAFAHHWAGPEGFVIDTRLREYDFGDWDGRTAACIHAEAPEQLGDFWQDPWHCPPPGAEPLPAFFARLTDVVDELQTRPAERVLLICHGGVIRALRCILNGLPVSDMLAFPVAHGSLHRLRDARR
ncbi:alpha-ribazole phosphatase family protein [Marinobacterium sp. AK62]|uniref:Alpha-ribazole phosphatase family protein n=1 Tax=Marinobacterium alkalitolerans TaxID=1542925 RepID=A0ABS3Z6I9_9GAMM|nr:alpha-ribazole phosphatase family protein [Marinobacterium alkalitolerans]MBP0047303.1 alpha-ribazole phosphatase family protein [Marinobacterium alkalitolerans]